ncbi:MAG: hypothetical protein GTN89_01415, partial [Acidobacteria bacterium]|nr:hypothetical protein [Acidobacteriota bacterium]NIQ29049.1 hypothetical protein [Acidobacteriota bacterium]NIQ83573.1 hypothetical protein [Acidobacteriota bacterium]
MGQDTTHANNIWWHSTTERAFTGNQSLHWGVRNTDDNLGWTTPMGVMEAVETREPIAMGFDRICSNSPLTACTDDAQCGGNGGEFLFCAAAKPRAVWKHQVSLMDFRGVNASGPLRSADGGVIHVQLADPSVTGPTSPAVGDWIKVETVANQYDSQREDNYNVCTFDPVDDGNDEDDFFDPTDPFRRYGPSSTCFPEFSYTYMGDTDTAFDPLNIGNASQGPGLMGAVGPGTWVESVVDFTRFRAQYVRVR